MPLLSRYWSDEPLVKVTRNGRLGWLAADGRFVPSVRGAATKETEETQDPGAVTMPDDLAALSAEQLHELHSQVDARISSLSTIEDDDLTPEDVEALDVAVQQLAKIESEQDRREAEKIERASKRAALLEKAGRKVVVEANEDPDADPVDDDGDDEGDGEPETNDGKTPEPVKVVEPVEAAEPKEEKVLVAASAKTGHLADANRAAARRPVRRPALIVPAAAKSPSFSYEVGGQRFSNSEAFIDRMAATIARDGAALSRANGGIGTRFATMSAEAPEALTLRGDDPKADNAKWNAAWNRRTYVGPHEDKLRSLVASTNFDPGQVISDPLWKASRSTRSPVAESLPTFNVPRGKATIRRDWMWNRAQPATGSIGYRTAAELAAAVDTDPENDPDPKPRARPVLSYRAWFEVKTMAQSQRLLMSNYTDLTDPDGVRQFLQEIAPMEMLIEMETLFLTRIKASLKTATVAAYAKDCGATVAFLEQTWRAVANDRSYHRFEESQVRYTIAVPERILDIITRDLLLGAKGLSRVAGLEGASTTAMQILNRWGTMHGIDWLFYADDIAGMSHVATAQANTAALQGIPTSVQWGMWPTGVFQVMKQAELNFGVTRDSTLNATNEYEVFTERFFDLVYVGVKEDPTDEASKPESALWVTAALPQTGVEGYEVRVNADLA